MSKDVVTFDVLATRLERTIEIECGMRALKILIYGWMQWRIRHGRKKINFRARAAYFGSEYMKDDEIREFSKYVGYNLS